MIDADDLAAVGGVLPPTDGLRYRTDRGVRVVVRPSGTEPKLKCYLEAVRPPGDDVAAERRRAAATVRAVRAGLSAALGL